MTRDNKKTNADGAWAAAGSSAWCALTETSPEAATPEDLALQATAVDDALCEAGVDARIAADGVRELRARAEKAESEVATLRAQVDAYAARLVEIDRIVAAVVAVEDAQHTGNCPADHHADRIQHDIAVTAPKRGAK